MKRKLKEFAFWLSAIILFFFGCIFYIDYEVEGDLGFITAKETTVYQAPRQSSKKIDTVHFGDDITIVKVGLSNNRPFVKVRMEYPDKRPKIGYIHENMIGHYEFPDVSITDKNFLIFLDEDISLEEFIPEFQKAIAETNIVGVYFKKEVIGEQNRSDLEHFFTSIQIPWGFVTDLDEESVQKYEEYYLYDSLLSPREKFEDFNILPIAFNIGNKSTSSLVDDMDFPFIFLSNTFVNTNNVPIWIDNQSSSTENNTLIEEESIFAYTYEKYSSFSLVKISEGWSFDISNAFETAREEAAQ